MFGNNKIMKANHTEKNVLQVQEIFETIQGEGPSVGTPAIFIRLMGCNLQCSFCDTDFESSDWEPTVHEICSTVEDIKNDNHKLVVITGGEPFRQNIIYLVSCLLQDGYDVEIETAGTLWIKGFSSVFAVAKIAGRQLRIICSPKTPVINTVLAIHAHSYKYIIGPGIVDINDGLPMYLQNDNIQVARPRTDFKGDIFVQPCDVKDEVKNAMVLIMTKNIAKRHGYRLSLQTHKLIGEE